jgi:hypothetical protein
MTRVGKRSWRIAADDLHGKTLFVRNQMIVHAKSEQVQACIQLGVDALARHRAFPLFG